MQDHETQRQRAVQASVPRATLAGLFGPRLFSDHEKSLSEHAFRKLLDQSSDNVGVAGQPASLLPLITPPKPKSRSKDRRGGNETSLLGMYARLSAGQPERRSFRERRATPRMPVELECEENHGGSRFVRLTTDLSTFGLSTRHGPTPPRGTKLTIRLFLPDEPKTPLTLDAHVLGAYDLRGGMRLKFRKPSIEAVRRIHRFLTTQPS